MPTAKQIAARKKFAAMAKSGKLARLRAAKSHTKARKKSHSRVTTRKRTTKKRGNRMVKKRTYRRRSTTNTKTLMKNALTGIGIGALVGGGLLGAAGGFALAGPAGAVGGYLAQNAAGILGGALGSFGVSPTATVRSW